MGLADVILYSDEPYAVVVGDYHGSPGSLIFYGDDGKELLSIRLSIFYPEDYKFTNLRSFEPVITGHSEVGDLLKHYFDIYQGECDGKGKCIKVEGDHIKFLYSGKLLFRLNIKSYRIKGDNN